MKKKLYSRVFWMCAASFVSSVAVAAIGASSGDGFLAASGMGLGVVSAGIYSICEKATDIARIKANSDTRQTVKQTVTTKQVTASSDDMYTVAAVLAPGSLPEGETE